jgi:Protein of unknown function (DUF1593)
VIPVFVSCHWQTEFSRRSENCFMTMVATFSPTSGLAADAQATGPNPVAYAMANAKRAQQPRFRFIYNDDAEIDGVSEFMRFLLYANDFADSHQGIVYTSSEFHYRGDPNANPPIPPYRWSGSDLPAGVDRIEIYQTIIAGGGYFGRFGGYAAAYPNLRKHDPRYPTPEHLLSLVKVGNVDNVGEMTKVREGSTLMKQALLADDPRLLWLVTGGGTNTISAALSQVAEQYQNAPVGSDPQAYYRDDARIHHLEPGQYSRGLHQGLLA